MVAGGARELKARLSIAPRDRRIVFLILWVAVPLVFFSLSQSKRPQYVLPLIPGIGLLVAALWHRAAGPLAGVRSAAAALAAAGLLFLSVRHRIAGWIDTTDPVAAAIPATALGLGTACLLGAFVAWFGTRQRTLALLGLLIPVTSIPLVSTGLMHEIGADRSAERIAAAIDRIGGSRIQVVAVGTFPLSLPFYLRRPILLSTDDGAEMTSNFLIRHFDDWRGAETLRPAAWWQEALVQCSRPRVFVVRTDDLTTRNRLGDHLALIVETRKHAVYGPCGLSDLALGS